MITQPVPGFSWRPPGSSFSAGHQAVDIPAPQGTPAVAVADGVVRSVGEDTRTPYNLDLSEWGGGTMVVVEHAVVSGRSRLKAEAQYAHLSAASVKPGQVVRPGDRLGLVGSTGNSTGPHLHFGWRVGGVWRDYRQHLPGGVYAGQTVTAPAGAGNVQAPPNDPFGNPVSAYPLDRGKVCPVGYNRGLVNPRAHGALPGSIWWNRPNVDGMVEACVREDLGPGDEANFAEGQGIAAIAEAVGDTARNAALLVAFLVLLLIGLYVLVKGGGGAGAAVSV